MDRNHLRKSWQKILPITSPNPSSTDKRSSPTPVLADMLVAGDEAEGTDMSSTSPKPRGTHKCGMWRGLRIRISHSDGEDSDVATTISGDVLAISDDVQVEDFQILLNELGVEIESSEIVTDAEICELVSRSSDEIEPEDEEDCEEEPCPVTDSDTARMFEWLEYQPEDTVYNTSVLRELHAMAAKKRMQSIKQTKLDKYVLQVVLL